MNYGFVIDNRKCIGCHACSTACKAENEVPLGVNRTWVKYVETGRYPDVRRHFQVTRCNHCANPPCVRICPVTAMYQRHDGIVEFDPRICIGCKACMQACPYDAIYIDPETQTAAKCHYCSHRVDIGLEPACVVVCPEHAILAGDMDDPASEISRTLATQNVTVRKPEQGTAPKLFYIERQRDRPPPDGHPGAAGDLSVGGCHPAARDAGRGARAHGGGAPAMKQAHSGVAIYPGQAQGSPAGGPIVIGGGRMAEHMVQTSYNAQHKAPWHWPVPAYLVTKGIGAGLFMVLALGFGLGIAPFDALTAVVAGFVALLFIAITTGLLVYDLDKPLRFLSILYRPQWRSWLTRGAFLLVGFTLVAGLWWLLESAAYLGMDRRRGAGHAAPAVAVGRRGAGGGRGGLHGLSLRAGRGPRSLAERAAALPPRRAGAGRGSGMLLLLDLFLPMPAELTRFAVPLFVMALVVDLFVTLAGEFSMPHASELAARAAHEISHGRYRRHFWQGGIVLGHAVPLLLVATGLFFAPLLPLAGAVAAICAVAGLYFYEYAFVMAPQEIPNS